MKRRKNGPQIRKIQEKGDAVEGLQLSKYQGPAKELREGPGNLSGHSKGPGSGGTPQDERTIKSSKEGPPPNRGADKPQERTRSQRGTKTRENSLGRKGRASRRPQGGEAEKTTPDRGADKLSAKYIE